MKLVDYGILFWIIITALFLPVNWAIEENVAYAAYEIQYHQKMDNAVDDALFAMVEKDNYEEIQNNREECIQTFYRSFYGNFGFSDHPLGQQKIRKHLPFIGFVEREQFIIAFQKPMQQEKEMRLTDCWTKGAYYERKEGGWRFRFYIGALRDWIQILPPNQKHWEKGTRLDIVESYPEITWLRKEKEFHQIRRATVLKVLKSEMQEIVNKHNLIAQQYGFQYECYLPEIKDQAWCRNVDDIGIMVLFQGYPVDSVLGYTYQRFVYSGARVYKREHSL